MICDGCFERVKQALIVRTEIIDSEEQYFKILRDEEEQDAGESNVMEKGQEACGSGELSATERVNVKQGKDMKNILMEAVTTKQECKICHKTYKSEVGFRCHLATAHGDPANARFKCVHCSKRFHFKCYLNSHIAENKNCLKLQQKLGNVKTHEKARSSNLKAGSSNLKAGTTVRQGCNICHKTFKNKDGLRSHLSSAHATNGRF